MGEVGYDFNPFHKEMIEYLIKNLTYPELKVMLIMANEVYSYEEYKEFFERPMSLSFIGEKINMKSHNVSAIVSKLEERGLIYEVTPATFSTSRIISIQPTVDIVEEIWIEKKKEWERKRLEREAEKLRKREEKKEGYVPQNTPFCTTEHPPMPQITPPSVPENPVLCTTEPLKKPLKETSEINLYKETCIKKPPAKPGHTHKINNLNLREEEGNEEVKTEKDNKNISSNCKGIEKFTEAKKQKSINPVEEAEKILEKQRSFLEEYKSSVNQMKAMGLIAEQIKKMSFNRALSKFTIEITEEVKKKIEEVFC